MLQQMFETGSILYIALITNLVISLVFHIFVKSSKVISLLGNIINIANIFGIILIIAYCYKNTFIFSKSFLIADFIFFKLELIPSNLGIVFTIMVSLLWIIAFIYTFGYLKVTNEQNSNKYLFFINLSVSSAIIAGFSHNLFTLFTFYELLSLSTILLIGHNFTLHASRSLNKYIIYLVGSSLFLWLPAIVILKFFIGTTDFIEGGYDLKFIPNKLLTLTIILCFLGVAKTAIFPLHGWLTAAMVAGYPVSALLHAVAVVKVGIFTILKIVTEIYGIEFIRESFHFLEYFKIAACIGIVYGSFMALFQDTLKKLLAYSTISNLNIMLVSIFMMTKYSIKLTVMYMLVHSFTKITLFYSAGYIYSRTYSNKVSEFSGSFRKFPLMASVFTLSGIILTGIPVFQANITKYQIFSYSVSVSDHIVFYSMTIATIFNILYIGRIILNMASEENVKKNLRTDSSSFLMKLASCLTLFLAFNSQEIIKLLSEFI